MAIVYEKYSYEDYKLWEGNWELIDGVAYAMAPNPVKRHQNLSVRIAGMLENFMENCQECEVLVEEDYKIDEFTILKPDISVVCNDKNPNYISKAPEIVVEIISPSTAYRDENIKFNLYEKEGVKYYVIVYPDELKAKIYKLINFKYVKIGDFFEEEFLFEDIKCNPKIDFFKIFKRYKNV